MKFRDRKEAGKILAEHLKDYRNDHNILILALPRGGVPIALEIARLLNAKMDVFLVRKLGFPGHEEYAMGAISEGEVIVWNEDAPSFYMVSEHMKNLAVAKEKAELLRRSNLYRSDKSEIEVKGKKVIIVDDGLATGSTMIAAIKALKKRGANRIIAAVPVCPKDIREKLSLADEVICLNLAEEFFGVGQFYENFDQLEDAQVMRALKESKKFGNDNSDVAGIIKKHSVSLKDESSDYDEIIKKAKNKRFVLIGEASHGTKEFYHIRAQITKRLIEELGFCAVAVEADWPDAFHVNCYVKNIETIEDFNSALSRFRRFPVWMWRNREVARFVEWLRSHNLMFSKQVGFYGIDLYSLNASIAMIVKYLNKVDKRAAEIAKYRYGCFDVFSCDPQVYGRATALGLKEDCEDKVIEELKELQKQKFDLLTKGMKKEDFFSAEQNARLVQNAEKYYRAMFKGRPSSWNIRDTHMADTIDELDSYLSQENTRPKIVVWAHNSHLGDARATDMNKHGEINIGALMRQRHGKDTLIVGFTTYNGAVTAADSWDQPEHYKKVNDALYESYEHLFHKVGGDFVLDLNKNLKLSEILSKQRLQRFIGVIYAKQTERQSHYYNCSISNQYDFVIHIDRSSAIHPLFPSSIWEHAAKEDLETYPTGL